MSFRLLRSVITMSFIFASVLGFAQERTYRYQLKNTFISYRIPKELQAAFTRINEVLVSSDDRVIYTTVFLSRGLLAEKSVGNFTIAAIAMPEELHGDRSISKLGEHFKTALTSTVETVKVSVYPSQRGEWLKIERRPVKDSSQVSGVLFYRAVSEQHILFVGLGAQPPEWWPSKLLKNLLPAVEKVVDSIEYTGGN